MHKLRRQILVIVSLGALACLTACGFLSSGRLVSGSVIFEENFVPGQMGTWFLEGDAVAQSAIANESLHISVIDSHTVQYTALQEPLFDNFILEVEATQLEGGLSSSYGILFRLQNPSQFYRFDITSNGLYVVEKSIAAGQWQRMTDGWVPSPFIIQGLNRTNHLKVEAVGNQLKFFINQRQVEVFTDDSYGRGQIALDAGTFNQGGLSVAFDNVVVRQP